jgi:transcriptional regulator
MYQPPHHREDRLDVQHALIRAHPLGALVTYGASGLSANLIPFVLDAAASPNGTLRGHVARANPQWRDFDPAVEALVVFQGVERYITPSWYAAKREHGKVVPTWNYATVQARGPMRAIEDRDWLAIQIAALTAESERGRAEPWSVSDAPEAFVAAQIKGIVGLEIPIASIEGKWKVSQNRPEADRQGVIAGLREAGEADADAMADLVARFGPRKGG